jgi:hypothetical protein
MLCVIRGGRLQSRVYGPPPARPMDCRMRPDAIIIRRGRQQCRAVQRSPLAMETATSHSRFVAALAALRWNASAMPMDAAAGRSRTGLKTKPFGANLALTEGTRATPSPLSTRHSTVCT